MLSTTAPSVLRAAGSRTGTSIGSIAALRRRWLSTSPAQRAGHVVTFGNTSTPELAEILDNLRQKVFLPTYLAIDQQKRIHNAKAARALQNDPVTMEIDGVVHRFRYVDRMTEIPNTREAVSRAIDAMKTPADFQNVPALLEGCVRARRHLPRDMYTKLIRRAAMHGSIGVILDCVKAVDRTGFKLDTSEKINELLAQLSKPAIESNFDDAKTKHALRQVRLVLNILESSDSHRPTPETSGQFPFHRDPQLLAVRLHLAAARAARTFEGKDVRGEVARYAQELVALWPEGAGVLDLQPDAAYQDRNRTRYLLDRNTFLWYVAPVLNGLTLAAQVVDPALAMQLQNRADAVDGEVKAALESPDRVKGGRGEHIYNALFNPQAAEAEAAEEEEI